MKRLWVIVAMAGMLTGCMHRNMVVMDMPPDSIAQVNREIAGKSGLARLQTGEILEGRDFQVDRDFTQWIQSGDSIRVMPNLDLRRITVSDPRTGILRAIKNGPWIGTLVGAVGGALVYAIYPERHYEYAEDNASADDEKDRVNSAYGRDRGPIINWIAGGALAGLTGGTVLSLFIGSGYYIRIEFASPHGR